VTGRNNKTIHCSPLTTLYIMKGALSNWWTKCYPVSLLQYGTNQLSCFN